MQLVLRGRVAGQDVVNVHHFEATAAQELLLTSDTDAQAWADAVKAGWLSAHQTRFRACHPNDWLLNEVVAQVLERPSLLEHKLTETTSTPGSAGTVGAGSGSLSSAAVIKWTSAVAGKHHRGRTFIGPIPTGFVLDGALVSTLITPLDAYRTNLVTSYSGATPSDGALLTIYSRPLDAGEQQWTVRIGGSLVVRANVDYDGNSSNVTGSATDPIARSQRRREVGVGS